jgi:hypothetical protein
MFGYTRSKLGISTLKEGCADARASMLIVT